jgi:hypothetical protein
MSNKEILLEAKNHYLKKLTNLLVPFYIGGFKKIWVDVLSSSQSNKLKTFQLYIEKISIWNSEIIHQETLRCVSQSKSNEERVVKIMNSCYNIYSQILSVINPSQNKKLNITVPTIETFVHKCYIEIAKQLFQDPYLIDDRQTSRNTSDKISENCYKLKSIVSDAVENVILNSLNLEDILDESNAFDEQRSDDSSSDVSQELPQLPQLSPPQQSQELPQLSQSPKSQDSSVSSDSLIQSFSEIKIEEPLEREETKDIFMSELPLREREYNNYEENEHQSGGIKITLPTQGASLNDFVKRETEFLSDSDSDSDSENRVSKRQNLFSNIQ